MDQKQSDELYMLEDVQSLFNITANAAKIAAIQDLQDGKIQLDTDILDLRKNKAVQDRDTKGVTGNKDALFNSVAGQSKKISGALVNLGRKTNNDDLIQQFDVSQSHLDGLSGSDLVTYTGEVVAAANANITPLGTGGLTQAMVDQLEADAAELHLKLTSPELEKEKKVVAGQNIDKIFSERTRPLMEQTLKPLMLLNFETQDEDFYGHFVEAAKRNETGVRHLDMFGYVNDSATSLKVNGATIKIFQDGALILTVRSGSKGNYRIKHLPEGTYSAEVSRPGYVTATFNNLVIISGNSLTKNFGLAPVV
jgi:hypothetical protein